MTSAATLRLIALAIAGILVAAGVAVIASNLASRQIGLASEPISAGDELAPPAARPQREGGGDGKQSGKGDESSAGPSQETSTSTGETTESAPNVPATPPGEGARGDDYTAPSEGGGGERGGGAQRDD